MPFIHLAPSNLRVTYDHDTIGGFGNPLGFPGTIYIYTSRTAGASPAYSAPIHARGQRVFFHLPPGTYYVSQRPTYASLPTAPKTAVVTDGSIRNITITIQN